MKRILIVDDASFMRLAINEALVNSGFEVAGEAEDGKEAIEQYKLLKPDAVTMDITMPVMSGLEALKEIMKLDPNAKVLMISALGQDTQVKEAILNGAKSFIVKPFQEEKVVQVLNKILES
ncbi:chemotaxis protein CheY [Anaerocolumna cellulosilytica]|uniref:Stage 0 sporulation protein A homolog n=1 Tax=Anaerocolumna cellulosilytica TaxID=433286 RepID=A0A6S6R8R6_9FIRM|nr:response regulator [Anaerocolumna cellulosilytica]BCJ95692.1 chemotaxis protein CheY [Anaerocolumna cellulosilytica]